MLLTEREARRLGLDYWRPLLNGVPDELPLVLLDSASGQYTLNKVEGRCVFLDTDQLCIVHKSSGMTAKPTACQFFPFQTVQTPEGIALSLNVSCRRLIEMGDSDDPLDVGEARRLLNEVQAMETLGDTVPLTPERSIPFDELKEWITRFESVLQTEGVSGVAALLQTLSVTDPALTPSALWDDLARLTVHLETLRPSLKALYGRVRPHLTPPKMTEKLPDFFLKVAHQHLQGYQFMLHANARAGWVALLAAFEYALGTPYRSAPIPDHALNEALADGIDLFLSPAGKLALTEPNQSAFLGRYA